jgi:hypothetical protein
MAFIIENNTVISFAEYSDLAARDQRLFDNNESLTDDVVEPLLIRATERILAKIRASDWWVSYYIRRDISGTPINTVADIPALDPDKIAARQNDFADLCVYTAMSEYILPLIADFGEERNAEVEKMGYYTNKAESLLIELLTAGDWYDFSGNGSISSAEKQPGHINLKRVR